MMILFDDEILILIAVRGRMSLYGFFTEKQNLLSTSR